MTPGTPQDGLSGSSYGPHSAALAHALADLRATEGTREAVERRVRRAHNPALGLDRSVCLRDVLAAAQEWVNGDPTEPRTLAQFIVDRLEAVADLYRKGIEDHA